MSLADKLLFLMNFIALLIIWYNQITLWMADATLIQTKKKELKNIGSKTLVVKNV